MFWYIAYFVSLFLLFGGFASFFEDRRNQTNLTRKNIVNVLVVSCLYLVALSVVVFEKFSYSISVELMLISLGIIIAVTTIYFSRRYNFK